MEEKIKIMIINGPENNSLDTFPIQIVENTNRREAENVETGRLAKLI